MPSLSTQVKTLQAIREILLGDGSRALPQTSEAKPSFPLSAAPGRPLPRCTPEEAGLSSALLASFCRDVANTPGTGAHSLLILRHGKVVAEGYFSPFRQGVWHVTHSLCKSFTGTAVGMAIAEGLFALDDPVAQYFPDKAGLLTSRQMRAVTVRHLLTMTSGITFNEVNEAVENDWVKGIFSSSVANEAGSKFVYNSMNSFLLSALIQKTSGQTLVEYLTPRLFQPMGFGPLAWEKSPDGYEKGGWGMYLCVEDMAKLGVLYLQKGRWQVQGETRQLLPESWTTDATRVHARGEAGEAYGYHLWVDSDAGNTIMNGMFGQYVTMIPALDMVIAMTAGNPRLFTDSPAYTLMRHHFYGIPSLPQALPADPYSLADLRRTLAGLRFGRPAPVADRLPQRIPNHSRQTRWNLARETLSSCAPAQNETASLTPFCGTTWAFPKNRGGLLPLIVQAMNNNFSTGVRAVHLETETDGLRLLWEEGEQTFYLPVGVGRALETRVTVKDESFLLACQSEVRTNEDGETVLIIEICFLEHSSFRLLKLSRKGEDLLLRIDEGPQFVIAIETVMHQQEATSAAPISKRRVSISDRLFGSEYLHYRIRQLCTPELLGTPY